MGTQWHQLAFVSNLQVKNLWSQGKPQRMISTKTFMKMKFLNPTCIWATSNKSNSTITPCCFHPTCAFACMSIVSSAAMRTSRGKRANSGSGVQYSIFWKLPSNSRPKLIFTGNFLGRAASIALNYFNQKKKLTFHPQMNLTLKSLECPESVSKCPCEMHGFQTTIVLALSIQLPFIRMEFCASFNLNVRVCVCVYSSTFDFSIL